MMVTPETRTMVSTHPRSISDSSIDAARPRSLAAAFVLASVAAAAAAQLTDLSTWTLVEDPPNASFSVAAQSPTAITLAAADASPSAIPAGTDLGFQSVNAATVADATEGFAFAAHASFTVAIDYDAAFTDAATGLGWGFGIGEDINGENSAGTAVLTQAGLPADIPLAGPVGGAAVVDDQSFARFLMPAVPATPDTLAGTLFAAYDADTRNITVGWGPPGAAAAASFATFPAPQIADRWTGRDLLVSFFIRSDNVDLPFLGLVSTPWTSGAASVTFSNLRVLAGDPCAAPADIDINDDDAVNADDLLAVIALIGAADPLADLNADNRTDFFDLLEALERFADACPGA